MKTTKAKTRYALVGLGHIAQNAVLPGFMNATANSELVALVSGDPVKLRKLAQEYKIEHTFHYSEYRKLLYSGFIDAVYIALPNHLHARYATEAMRAGVHVLCEKPLAMKVEDAHIMNQISEETNCKLMTAYRLHFQKANLRALQIVQSGQLGDVRVFNSLFSMRIKKGNVRTDKRRGGGPLYDIGIYCINAVRNIFGELPEQVFAFANSGFDARSAEVEEMISVSMKFSGGRLANFVCSFSADSRADYEVLGTLGSLRLQGAYEYFGEMELRVNRVRGGEKVMNFAKSDQFGPEIVYFSDCVQNDRMPETNATEGILDLMVIEAVQQSLKTKQPVSLTALFKSVHPSIRQAIRRPAVPKPLEVHVSAPSRD